MMSRAGRAARKDLPMKVRVREFIILPMIYLFALMETRREKFVFARANPGERSASISQQQKINSTSRLRGDRFGEHRSYEKLTAIAPSPSRHTRSNLHCSFVNKPADLSRKSVLLSCNLRGATFKFEICLVSRRLLLNFFL